MIAVKEFASPSNEHPDSVIQFKMANPNIIYAQTRKSELSRLLLFFCLYIYKTIIITIKETSNFESWVDMKELEGDWVGERKEEGEYDVSIF